MACELTNINDGIRALKNSKGANSASTKAEIAKLEQAKELLISSTMEVAALDALDAGGSVKSAINNAIETSPGYIALIEELYKVETDLDKATAGQARSYANKIANDFKGKIPKKTGEITNLDNLIEAEEAKITEAMDEPSKASDILIVRSTKYLEKLRNWRAEAMADRKAAKGRDTREKNAVLKLRAIAEAHTIINEKIKLYRKQFAANTSLLSNQVTSTNTKGAKVTVAFDKHFDVKPTYNVLQLIKDDSNTVFEDAMELRADDLEAVDVAMAQNWMNYTEGYIRKYFEGSTEVQDYDIGPSTKFESYQHISKLLQVQNADGSFTLPPKVVTVIAANINDYIVSISDTRWNSRTADDVNRFLGRPKDTPVTPKDYERLAHIDTFQGTAANSIGAKIVKDLGITTNDTDLSPLLLDKLKVELGLIAIDSMVKAGVVSTDSKAVKDIYPDSDSKNNIITLEISPKIAAKLDETGRAYHKAVKTINAILATDSQVKKPRFSAKKNTEHINRSAQGKFFTTAEATNDTLNKVENVEFKMDDTFIDALNSVLEEDENVLLEALGYVDPTTVHTLDAKSVESNNAAIVRNLENLMATREELTVSKATGLFFNYFFGKNGRLYMDSSTFNPQNTLLHRFAVYPGENTIKTEEDHKLYQLALGQAFGLDVDKFTVETSLKQWAELEAKLANILTPETSLTEALKALKKAGIKGHAPEHLIAGIIDYQLYKGHIATNKGLGKGFTSHLPLEVDAVTSGYILKTLQMPLIDDYETHLESGGVMFKGEDGNWRYGSFGEQYENPNTLDSYEKPAKAMVTKLQDAAKAWKSEGNTQLSIGASLALNMNVKDIDPNASKTKKTLRNFMKPPFMVFNYGAGMGAIKGTVIDAAIDNFYKSVTESSGVTNGDAEVAAKRVEGLIKSAQLRYQLDKEGKLTTDGKSYAALINSEVARLNSEKFSGEGRLNFVLHPELELNLRSGIEFGIGKELEDVFNATYKDNMEASKTINAAFTGMFRMFKAKLDKSISNKQDELGRDLTNAEYDLLVEELSEHLPAVKVALATKESDKLMIFEEASGEYDATKSGLNVTGQGKFRNSATNHGTFISAYAKKYELVEAMAAGAVIPIHYIDGSLVTIAAATTNALNVFDAFMTLPLEAAGVAKNYNKAVGDISADYNLAYEIASEFQKTISSLSNDEMQAVNDTYIADAKKMGMKTPKTIDDIYEAMKVLSDVSTAARDKLYSKDMRIEHLAMPGGHYDRIIEKQTKPGTVKSSEGEITSPVDSAIMSDNITIDGLSDASIAAEIARTKNKINSCKK